MKLADLMKATIIVACFYGARGETLPGRPGAEGTTPPFMALSNELIDETLKWVKYKYLCGYDPLELPPVTQDDLNVTYALTISEIHIEGLSNVFRLEDVEIEKYDGVPSFTKFGNFGPAYTLSSTLGVRNVTLKFRIEMLKIMSLTVVDFIANGSVPEIDIPLLVLVSPVQRHIHFDNILIENLDQITIDIKSQNFLTSIGGAIPSVQNYIKTQIKDAIKENLESHIGDAKSYLNKLLDSATSFEQSKYCAAPGLNGTNTGNNTGTRFPIQKPPPPQYVLAVGSRLIGLPKAFGLIIKYKSRVVGTIPVPPVHGQNSSGNNEFFGFYDSERNEFVLNQNGIPLRHLSTSQVDPTWTLTSSREEDTFCLFAKDDSTSTKIKLNPFITRISQDD